MQYNQAFRQMMLCLEDMSELDKLSHYERGLESKYRIAVRQARCADIASAMAEVDIVADAHQVHVVLPNIANHHVSAPASKAAPYMGVEPVQISTVRNNNSKYGRKKQPRMQNGFITENVNLVSVSYDIDFGHCGCYIRTPSLAHCDTVFRF